MAENENGTLRSRILALVTSKPGLTDREITDRLLGPDAGQQRVNSAARTLEAKGQVNRRQRETDRKIGNFPTRVNGSVESSPASSGDGKTPSAALPVPTLSDIEEARVAFDANEPRGLFYRAATLLVDLALKDRGSARSVDVLTLEEAIAVLLQTWNRAYYQYHFHGKFSPEHFDDIKGLLEAHRDVLARFRRSSIESVTDHDRSDIEATFTKFEKVLGPVGRSGRPNACTSSLPVYFRCGTARSPRRGITLPSVRRVPTARGTGGF